jgi:glutathione peroxidase
MCIDGYDIESTVSMGMGFQTGIATTTANDDATPIEKFMTSSIYNLSCRLINGNLLPLSQLRGQVLLIVNTASYCGFTSQYRGLENLYRKYSDRGFAVLAFPSNDFMEEPFSDERVHNFCLHNYGVSFPLFAKVHVNGRAQDPLFAHLKRHAPGLFFSRSIKWNFSKFLLDRDGCVTGRYGPLRLPSGLHSAIETLLDRPPRSVDYN